MDPITAMIAAQAAAQQSPVSKHMAPGLLERQAAGEQGLPALHDQLTAARMLAERNYIDRAKDGAHGPKMRKAASEL